VPIFLASSFAFIAPITYGVKNWGISATMGGLIAAGAVYLVLSTLVKLRGPEFITKLLPPVVVGPVIMIIGLGLAPTAVNMALGKTGDGSVVLVSQQTALFISIASFQCH
jgi:uracil permease